MKVHSSASVQASHTASNSFRPSLSTLGLVAVALLALTQSAEARATPQPKMVEHKFTYNCALSVEVNAAKAAAEVLYFTEDKAKAEMAKEAITIAGKGFEGVFFNRVSTAMFSAGTLTENCQKAANEVPFTYEGKVEGSVLGSLKAWLK